MTHFPRIKKSKKTSKNPRLKKSVKVKLMPLSSKVKIEDIASDLESRFEKTSKRFQNSSECRQILRKIIVDLSEENWKSLYKEIIGKGSI